MGVLSTLFSYESETQHRMSCGEEINSIPARPNTQARRTPATRSAQRNPVQKS